MSGDDIDFAAARAFEISFEDSVSLGAEEIDCNAFAVVADPLAVAGLALRVRQAAGRVEPPAETSDDAPRLVGALSAAADTRGGRLF